MAVPIGVIVGSLLAVMAAGATLLAEWRTSHRLETRLERLALQARYVGQPGGYLVFDERDHLLSTAPPAVREEGERFQIVSDPVLGSLAVLRLPVTTVGPHMVAIPARGELEALRAVRRTLLGMTVAGTLAALAAGYLLAGLALQPVDAALRERIEFVARASHQLRTPLSIIRTAAELGRGGLGVAPAEAFETVLRQAQRMEVLAARLTELARAEHRPPSGKALADVVGVLREILDAVGPMARQAGVALRLDAPPAAWVRAEPAEAGDILAAVVDNAVKFSPAGGAVVVRVRRDRTAVTIEVSDQGPGIGVRDLPHVTKPFYQGASARGGFGLGLAIARALVERRGGRLGIASSPGRGTTVTVTLPSARGDPLPAPPPAGEAHAPEAPVA